MNKELESVLDRLNDQAVQLIPKCTPGELAIITCLQMISAQLTAMADTQDAMYSQFNKVSAGGTALLTESA